MVLHNQEEVPLEQLILEVEVVELEEILVIILEHLFKEVQESLL